MLRGVGVQSTEQSAGIIVGVFTPTSYNKKIEPCKNEKILQGLLHRKIFTTYNRKKIKYCFANSKEWKN